MINHLHSDRLSVELTAPGTPPNDGFRFDRTGYISEVMLDDGTRFCASEPRNLSHESSKGRGFCACNSFKAGREVEPGQYFPIVGVGLVKKPEGEGRKFYSYEDFIPFEIKSEFTDNTAVSEVLPMTCNGYAFYEKRTVRVEGNAIINSMELENAGEKPISILEYCHNFVSIEGMAVGPDYIIELPQVSDLTGAELHEAERGGETNFEGFGRGFRIKEYRPDDWSVQIEDYSFYTGDPFVWRVKNLGAKAYVEGTEHIAFQRVKVWSCDHMVCPETYQTIELAPGEKASWSRELRFGRI